jgi:hypothetical protein
MTNDEKARRFERALALAGNTHTISDVMDKVRENRAQCWPNGDSVTITEILVYPRLKACNYWLSCGNLRECLDLEPTINAWAIEQGCAIATITGRMGWLRLSQMPLGAGWKPQGIRLVKSLQS